MLNINKNDLKVAIKNSYPFISDTQAEKQAETLICTTNERLKKNLSEWINGQPISDIWIGEYCINAIMSIRRDKDFLSALEAMNLYLKDEEAGILKIWRTKK